MVTRAEVAAGPHIMWPMTEQPPRAWPTSHRIAGEAFGIRVFISTNSPDLMTEVEHLLPPGWVSQEPPDMISDAERDVPHFVYGTDDGIEYLVTRNAAELARSSHSVALHVLDAQLRAYIARYSPARGSSLTAAWPL
jgi:hypothetical protein